MGPKLGDGSSFTDMVLLPSVQGLTAPRFIDRSLLPVADQHGAARGRELWTVFLEAGQNGEIALGQQLAAETMHVRCASLLVLFRAAMRKGAGRNRNRQQDERQEEFVHCDTPSDFHHCNGYGVRNAVHSIT